MKHVEKGENYRALRKSLLNVMLVNHEWAEAGSYILWQSLPVSALAWAANVLRFSDLDPFG